MSKSNSVNTFVFYGDFPPDKNPFACKFLGTDPRQWARGNALDEKEKLEDFIRKLSFGDIENPATEAKKLMNDMGWG